MNAETVSNEKTESIRKELDPLSFEKAQVGYQVAVSLWTYQGNLNWGRFNIMLTANSIIISAIGLVPSSPSIFRDVLPIAGLFLCILWLFLTARGFDYHKYWVSQARSIEEKYLSDVIKTISEAKTTKEGGKMEFGWLSKLGGSQKRATYLVIFVFVFVYVYALAFIQL
ncbi:MAG: hypothetical protein RBS57_20290 [Desulforhabdus sp.]|nr:hypothetical protein [Desulforhabdus sp.]